MKFFALYSKIDLIEKPDWFDAFYEKYNTSIGYHVTLKQPCTLEEKNIPAVKDMLSEYFASIPVPAHEIVLTFNELVLDESSNKEKTLMINAEYEPRIHRLQQEILSILVSNKEYVYPESQLWEENFKPHITVVSDVSSVRYQEVLQDLKTPYACKGRIQDVSLIVVEKMIPGEADKTENQTMYRL